jgi:hypothetical protein
MDEGVADYFGFAAGKEIVRTSRAGSALAGADKKNTTIWILAGLPRF